MDTYFIYGYVSNPKGEGFGLPIFRSKKSKALYFQNIDPTNFDKLVGFDPMNGFDESQIKKIKHPKQYKYPFAGLDINDEPIYMFEIKKYIFFDIRDGLYNILTSLVEQEIVTNQDLIGEIFEHFFHKYRKSNALPLSEELEHILFGEIGQLTFEYI